MELTLDDLTVEEIYKMLKENPDQQTFEQADLEEYCGRRFDSMK